MAKLEGGLGAINSNVMGALRGWLTTEAKALLETMPEEERGTSVLMTNVAMMLTDGGRLAVGATESPVSCDSANT